MVGEEAMFIVFFIVVLIIWLLAIIRRSVGMTLLSGICWFSFAISLFIFGDPDAGFTLGFAILAVLLAIIMFVLAIYQAFVLLGEQAAEKQRAREEDIP